MSHITAIPGYHGWRHAREREEVRRRLAQVCLVALIAFLLFSILIGKAVQR